MATDGPARGRLLQDLGISDPSQTAEAPLRALYDYWLANRDAAGRFHFSKFDITELPGSLIPLLYLIRVHRSERRFEARVVGQSVVELSGVNHTGCFFDELPGAELTQARLEFCHDNNLPYVASGPLTWGRYDYKTFSVCGVPLHDDEGAVAYVLGVVCVHGPGGKASGAAHRLLPSSNLPKAPSPILDAAFEYWLSKKCGPEIPLRSAIDPVEIPRLLPHLMLLDVLREPLDFRYRLIGEGIQANITPGFRGKTHRQLDGKGPGSLVWEGLRKVVETGIPRYGRAPYVGPESAVKQFLDLLLPLSEDGAGVSQILIVTEFRRT